MKLRLNISLLYLLVVGLGLLAVSCDFDPVRLAEPNEKIRPMAAYLKNNYEFSLFSAALEYTGLEDELNQGGPYTIFVPTNRAFNELGINRPEDFQTNNRDSLRTAIRYHILKRRLNVDNDIALGSTDNLFETIDGPPLYISRDETPASYNRTFVNGIQIQRKNLETSNGVLHSIDAVFKYHNGTIQSYLESQEKFSCLRAGLKKFGLWDRLKDEKPQTIVAPNNNAFKKNGISLEDINKMSTDKYGQRLFAAYLFPLSFFMRDFNLYPSVGIGYYAGAPLRYPIPGDERYTYGIAADHNNIFIMQSKYNDYPIIRDLPINQKSKRDHLMTNGVLHEIEELLILPSESLKP
ncbi:MAG: fasciclin domain-containing protein [Sphingobacterium sp.]|nr:fasciclin domain-containing protein [Sphingobacterium sp.]